MNVKTLKAALCFLLCAQTALCQDFMTNEIIAAKTRKALDNDQKTISDLLSDTSFMYMHSSTAFREIIKEHAKAEKIKIISDKEPGTKIIVKGVILNLNGKPVANALVYIYQTSSEGWYSDTAPHILQNEGDRKHARLFGYFKTNSQGSFEFETIKPKGYPNSDLPAHIHFEVNYENKSLITELLFDDDPRLIGDRRTKALQQQFILSANTGTEQKPVYVYNISMRQ